MSNKNIVDIETRGRVEKMSRGVLLVLQHDVKSLIEGPIIGYTSGVKVKVNMMG